MAEPRVQLRRPARLDLHAAAGPARPRRPQGDRDGDRQERDRRRRCTQGAATPGDTIVRPASAYWHLDIPADKEFAYDPQAANAICSTRPATSIRTATGSARTRRPAQPLEMHMPASTDTTGAQEAGELIVGYLKQIGIKVDLLPASDAKMNDYWGSGNFDAYIWYWSGDPDPNYQLFVFTSDQCGVVERRVLEGLALRQALPRAAHDDGPDPAPGHRQGGAAVRVRPGAGRRARVPQLARGLPHRPVHRLGRPAWSGWLRAARPTTTTPGCRCIRSGETTSSGSSSVPGWVWLVVVLAIVGIVLVVMRRGRKIEPDEA